MWLCQAVWRAWHLETILARAWKEWFGRVLLRIWHFYRVLTRTLNECLCRVVSRNWHLEIIWTKVWKEWTCRVVLRTWHSAGAPTRAPNQWLCRAVWRPWPFSVIRNWVWVEAQCTEMLMFRWRCRWCVPICLDDVPCSCLEQAGCPNWGPNLGGALLGPSRGSFEGKSCRNPGSKLCRKPHGLWGFSRWIDDEKISFMPSAFVSGFGDFQRGRGEVWMYQICKHLLLRWIFYHFLMSTPDE